MADANMYVLNPFFQTKSFDDMVKPLAMYAQAYKEQEAKIEDMTDKAAALEWIANQKPDSQTAALYRDMSAKIKGIRDDMMINGLQGGTRSRILGARRMYSANAAEITRRYEDMQKYQQRMEQLYDKDNSIVFSPESQDVSLDDFAGGRRPQIKAISGNEIMARGAAVGKRLTSQIFGDGVVGQEMGGQFWKTYQEQGMTDKALWNALEAVGKGDSTHFQMAKQVIDGVYNSFKDFSPYDQQRLKDRFIEGVYSGSVYNRQVDYQQNRNFESAAERQTRLFNQQMQKNQDARAQEEFDAKMKEWRFSRGDSSRWVLVEDDNGNKVKRRIQTDPTTGKVMDVTDLSKGTGSFKSREAATKSKNGKTTTASSSKIKNPLGNTQKDQVVYFTPDGSELSTLPKEDSNGNPYVGTPITDPKLIAAYNDVLKNLRWNTAGYEKYFQFYDYGDYIAARWIGDTAGGSMSGGASYIETGE